MAESYDGIDGIELDDQPLPEATEGAVPAAEKTPAPNDEVAELKAQLKVTSRELERANEERRQALESERVWQQKAAERATAPAAPAKAAKSEDLLDDIAERGTAALKDHGYITVEEARQIAADVARETVASAGRVNDYTREFPELVDPDSEISKEVKMQYQQLITRVPALAGTAEGWGEAVERVKLARGGAGNGRTTAPAAKDNREERIARQGAGGLGRSDVGDGGGRVSDQGKEIARRMGISADTYAKTKQQMRGSR